LIQITTCYFGQAAGRHVVSNGGRMQSLVLLATITSVNAIWLAAGRSPWLYRIEADWRWVSMSIHRNGGLGHHPPDFLP